MDKWNREQLLAFLCARDMTDLEDQPTEYLLAIAMSLDADVGVKNEGNPPAVLPATNSVISSDLVEEEHMRSTLSLLEVTGCDYDQAGVFLKSVNWDIGVATSLFFEHGSIDKAMSAVSEQHQRETSYSRHNSFASTGGQSSGHDDNNNFGPDDINFGYDNAGSLQGPRRSQSREALYDEDGIRLPDPVINQRLIGGPDNVDEFVRGFRFRGDNPRSRARFDIEADIVLGRAEDPSVEWLYDPPRQLSFPRSFQDAKAIAREEKRWLLVNIQSHSEFASHLLNRDTWTQEIIHLLLRSSFLFWQRGNTSGDGKNFMQIYQLKDSDLPLIAIIDARTGSLLLNVKGYIAASDLSAMLIDFMDSNSVDAEVAPAPKKIDASHWQSVVSQSQTKIDYSRKDDNDDIYVDNKSGSDFIDASKSETYYNRNQFSALDEILDSHESNTKSEKNQPITAAVLQKSQGYGDAPPEPSVEDSESIKVSIKLASGGKPLVRRFRSSDTVQALFAAAAAAQAAASGGNLDIRPFDIITSYPTKSLSDSLYTTLASHQLANSQVIMRWL